MNFWTSFLLFLNKEYIFPFYGLNVSLRSIAWSQVFLVSILSDFTFPKTFLYFQNFLGTISSIFLWSSSISFSFPQSFLSSIIHLTIFSFSRVTILFPLLTFFSSFFCPILPHNGEYLVILTFPVSQFISGLCAYNHSIPSITSVFSKLHMSILIFSIWPL